MAEILIRPVRPGDAPVLAHIQTQSWRAAFSAILTPEELERFADSGHVLRMQERLLAEMRAAGYERVLLWVFEENVRARRFYERHGFAGTGRRKTFGSAVEMMMERAL